MFFDLTAHVLLSAFDLAYRRVKNLPDRDERMLALGLVAMRLVDDDLLMLRHCDAKLDLEKIAAPVPGLRPGDDDMTARDARAELFEAAHLRRDLGSNLFRRLIVPEGDLNRHLHVAPQTCGPSLRF